MTVNDLIDYLQQANGDERVVLRQSDLDAQGQNETEAVVVLEYLFTDEPIHCTSCGSTKEDSLRAEEYCCYDARAE